MNVDQARLMRLHNELHRIAELDPTLPKAKQLDPVMMDTARIARRVIGWILGCPTCTANTQPFVDCVEEFRLYCPPNRN